MNIKVLSKQEAECFSHNNKWAAISISTSENYFANLNKENQTHLLQMEFWDTDRESTSNEEAIIFDQKLASTVWDFVFEVKDEIDLLLIHCEAGMSRSPAMAAAIEKVLIGDDQKWFDQKVPNMLVFRKMLNEANARELI